MKISTDELGTRTEREVAEKLATGEARLVCGQVVEASDPTNALNRQLACDLAYTLALEIKRKRGAR